MRKTSGQTIKEGKKTCYTLKSLVYVKTSLGMCSRFLHGILNLGLKKKEDSVIIRKHTINGNRVALTLPLLSSLLFSAFCLEHLPFPSLRTENYCLTAVCVTVCVFSERLSLSPLLFLFVHLFSSLYPFYLICCARLVQLLKS